MIADVIPSPVASAETRGSAAAPGELLDAELLALGAAAPRRRAEFAAGRSCARRALRGLGRPAEAIGRGPDREPRWPSGVVGSITHCPGYCAAAAAEASAIATIGIDAEVHRPLPDGVLERIALADEASWIADRRGDGWCWDSLLFSAKESVFKAWFPLARRWLGFEQARVTFNPAAGSFHAALLVAGPLLDGRLVTAFDGRFLVRGDLVVTAIALPARPSRTGPTAGARAARLALARTGSTPRVRVPTGGAASDPR